ncbi:mucin TcMUCII [Trypanosoma cruzi]|nr:mucin TcMUCII [Trypanosoma cruzi]
MTTCRLLCALLVLALCCCPSVCASDTETIQELNKAEEGPGPGEIKTVKPVGEVGHPRPSSERSDTEDGISGGKGPGLTAPRPKLSNAIDKVREKGTDSDTGLKSLSDISAEKTHEETEGRTKTTTTKKSPEDDKKSKPEANANATSPIPSEPVIKPSDASAHTTTTTTTQAPITTTTEAPTTTTTRAPSRLREMDGSLSSSAWLCAPLQLAVSALVYTTVG